MGAGPGIWVALPFIAGESAFFLSAPHLCMWAFCPAMVLLTEDMTPHYSQDLYISVQTHNERLI